MKLWLNKSEHGYYHTIKGKDKDKNEIKYYFDISFYGCEPPKTTGQIETDGDDFFFGCYNTKNGIKPKIIIKNYTFLRESDFANEEKPTPVAKPKKLENDPFEEFGDMVSTDDMLD